MSLLVLTTVKRNDFLCCKCFKAEVFLSSFLSEYRINGWKKVEKVIIFLQFFPKFGAGQRNRTFLKLEEMVIYKN